MSLKSDYEKVCQNYITAFAKKQGYEFDYWIGDDIGGVASFGEYYTLNLNDIRTDIDSGIKAGKIFEWYDGEVKFNMSLKFPTWINYKSWLKGARH